MDYNFTNIQKQTSQLDCQFSAPLVKDFVVETTAGLTNLSHNYPNKLVWVANEKSFYYLRDDSVLDGSQLSHWRKHGSSAKIEPYDSTKEYLPGECVYNQKKIYSAITNVPVNTAPPNVIYWECIAGDITSQCINITGDTIIEPIIDNPIIQVYDNNDIMVDCCVQKLNSIGQYGYNNFKISFEVDAQQDNNFTGYVIVK